MTKAKVPVEPPSKAESSIVITENLVFSGYSRLLKLDDGKAMKDPDSLEVFKINYRRGRTPGDLTREEKRLLGEHNSGKRVLEFRVDQSKRY